jgi:hypothetical protein
MELPATAIREGNVDRVDLTLLSIDEQKLPIYLRMRRMRLCESNPWPGEPIIVAIGRVPGSGVTRRSKTRASAPFVAL